jgi:hypothetical protein
MFVVHAESGQLKEAHSENASKVYVIGIMQKKYAV